MINTKAINSILACHNLTDLLMFHTFRHDGEPSFYAEAGFDHYVHAYNCTVGSAFLIHIFFKDSYLLSHCFEDVTCFFDAGLLLDFKNFKVTQESTLKFWFDDEEERVVHLKKVKHFKDFTALLQYFKNFFSKNGFRKGLLKPRNLYRILESTLTQEQKAA